MRRGRRVGGVWPPHARVAGADASHSRRLDRGTFGRARREEPARTGSGSQKPLRERARARAVYMRCIRRCKLCRFVKPFVLRPLPKGPVAKAVIVYFMACKYSISGETRVHMCAPQSTRHASSLHRSVAGSHGHASLLSPLSGTRELRTRTRHGRARRSPHAARTITFQHTRHYTEFYIAPLPLAGRCIASFRGQQVTSPRLV